VAQIIYLDNIRQRQSAQHSPPLGNGHYRDRPGSVPIHGHPYRLQVHDGPSYFIWQADTLYSMVCARRGWGQNEQFRHYNSEHLRLSRHFSAIDVDIADRLRYPSLRCTDTLVSPGMSQTHPDPPVAPVRLLVPFQRLR
jgi:hypothetical protein